MRTSTDLRQSIKKSVEPCYFSVNDTTLPADNVLGFIFNLLWKISCGTIVKDDIS